MPVHTFGGTTDAAAEDMEGNRLPNHKGDVYDGAGEDAQKVTDLRDMDGHHIEFVTSDQNGMVPMFQGPDGYTELWVDFGPGKYGLIPVDTAAGLEEHVTAADPHKSKQYTDEQLRHYVHNDSSNVMDVSGLDGWLKPKISGTSSSMILAANGDDDCSWNVRQDGSMEAKAKGGVDGIKYVVDANKAAFVASSRESGKATAQINGDGSASFTGPVSAPNIGGVRVFSGAKAPTNPQIGDVWVQLATDTPKGSDG
ncbi:hypothetical protein [Streptomyces sp. WZ-12]|uniref:hypothetical protein n=1 Tax=Streptomyces sp. WZ-12 TaxID=3030210 RepID=UPI00238102A0|nr:hypothetical protein [Streptomyces sp. WZ-12]